MNASGRDIAEAPGRCANNAAAVKFSGAPGCSMCTSCTTTITGKVYDPSGYAASPTSQNNVGLANVSVFQPAGALTPLTDNPAGGPACDTCASLSSPALASTVTNPDGTFTLTGVAPGPSQSLVVQSGRWRRQFSVGAVTACGTHAVPNGDARLPRNRTDGLGGVADIPRLALVLGAAETLECFLRRVGLSDSEFARGANDYAAAIAKPQRLHLYRASGWSAGAGTPSLATLMSATGPLPAYTAVIGSCDYGNHLGTWQDLSKTPAGSSAHDRLIAYANQGGRVFMDHYVADAMLTDGIAPWNGAGVATWDSASGTPSTKKVRINNTTPGQQSLYQFLNAANAMATYGAPYIPLIDPRFQVYSAGTNAIEWIRGLESWTAPTPDEWVGTPAGDHAMSVSFETPLGAAAGAECGRVIFNGMHVSQSRAPSYPTTSGQTFPNQCTGYPGAGASPSAEELALEYQLFQLTACAITPPPPPVIPPPPPLPGSQTYAVDFVGSCQPGEKPVWQLFQWKAPVPAGTSIDFGGHRREHRGPPWQSWGDSASSWAPRDRSDWYGQRRQRRHQQRRMDVDSSGAAAYTPRPVSWHLANDADARGDVEGGASRVHDVQDERNRVASPL